jgi:diguanylate cyclase (GGDEF)-like protein
LKLARPQPILDEVISIKKYLDLDPTELFKATLDSYRAALVAMGSCGVQACPTLGYSLQSSLLSLQERLSASVTPGAVTETEGHVEVELEQWGGRTAEYFKQKTNEVKEIMIVLARTAEAVGERDQRYTVQFNQFTQRLQAIADLEDLTQIRESLVRSATELKTCVDKMAQDGQESVAKLRSELSTYQTRLAEAERLASRDTLTGLDNRRTIEQQLASLIARAETFCLVILDLDGFKQINDTHGHLAGDDLLKQFATELRSAIRLTDAAGRWGGDEFIVILKCGLAGAEAHIERIRKWVLGNYTIRAGAGSRKVSVTASIGTAESKPGETLNELLGRADAAMYQQKSARLLAELQPTKSEAAIV